MDIKINFDQLFGGAPAADLNTTHTSLQPNSIELSHDFTASLNNSVEYKFSFNHQFFEEDLDHLEDDQFQPDRSEPQRPPKSTKSIKINQINQTNKPQKPGERLFYQSQQQQQRKMKQREKIHQEKQMQFSKSVTFVPSINQNSRRMAERQRQQHKQYNKTKNLPKPTVELIEEANQKECTFHPKLIAKNKNKTKSKDELFYYLHNTAKIKDMKIHKLAEEQYGQYVSNVKKGNQEDITNFLKRNEEYSSIVKKKQEILKNNSEKYDLRTGEKLFSPKIMENKAFNFHATASSKDLKSESGKSSTQNFKTNDRNEIKYENNQHVDYAARPKSGIFNKKYKTQSSEDYTYPYQPRQQQRRNQSIHQQANRSRHQVIVQVQENSIVQCEKDHHKVEQLNIFNPYHQDEIQGEQLNIWGSNEIKPFELSNVNQYLNASDEEETQHKGNYVMDILNNLIIKQDEDA